jgi:hypothetical protein
MKFSITVDVIMYTSAFSVVVVVSIVVVAVVVVVAFAAPVVNFLVIFVEAIASAVMATAHATAISSAAMNIFVVIRIHSVTIVRLTRLSCCLLLISSLYF